jgi:hypothetical protein
MCEIDWITSLNVIIFHRFHNLQEGAEGRPIEPRLVRLRPLYDPFLVDEKPNKIEKKTKNWARNLFFCFFKWTRGFCIFYSLIIELLIYYHDTNTNKQRAHQTAYTHTLIFLYTLPCAHFWANSIKSNAQQTFVLLLLYYMYVHRYIEHDL